MPAFCFYNSYFGLCEMCHTMLTQSPQYSSNNFNPMGKILQPAAMQVKNNNLFLHNLFVKPNFLLR